MAKIPVQDAETQFASAIKPTQADLDLALEFMTETVGDERQESDALIQKWWATRGAAPVPVLVLDDTHDFSAQLQQAARHWEARIAAARAIQHLSSQGYFAVGDNAHPVDRVKQDYTTAIDGSRAQIGTWNLEKFDVRFPASVYRSPFAEVRQARSNAPQLESAKSRLSATGNPLRPPPVLGDDHSVDWFTDLPPGLPAIVASAAARQKAIEDLRSVRERLGESSPARHGLEKKFVDSVLVLIDEAIDMLGMSADPDLWATAEPEAASALRRAVVCLKWTTQILSGVEAWHDAMLLVRRALVALGSS